MKKIDLYHFTNKNNFEENFNKKFYEGQTTLHRYPFKPKGFWLSIEERGCGWFDFCYRENFRIEGLKNCYIVELDEKINLLKITSKNTLLEFCEKYSKKVNDGELFKYFISWEKLYTKYDGIMFFPYKKSFCDRIHFLDLGQYYWYTTIDCDSLCVWNLEKIKKVTPLYKNLDLDNAKKILKKTYYDEEIFV